MANCDNALYYVQMCGGEIRRLCRECLDELLKVEGNRVFKVTVL